jgi:hypothetical protein
MARFVLRHAGEVLRKEDAEALLACERRQWDYQQTENGEPPAWFVGPWWLIAAADLKREEAGDLLHRAFGRYRGGTDHRAPAAVALWRFVGPAETEFLTEWFHTEQPAPGKAPRFRADFLKGINGNRPNETRKLVAGLIRDRRFETLNWGALEELVRIVNGWVERPLVSPEDLKETQELIPQDLIESDLEEAKRRSPADTEKLLKILDGWRAALRESIPQWSK